MKSLFPHISSGGQIDWFTLLKRCCPTMSTCIIIPHGDMNRLRRPVAYREAEISDSLRRTKRRSEPK